MVTTGASATRGKGVLITLSSSSSSATSSSQDDDDEEEEEEEVLDVSSSSLESDESEWEPEDDDDDEIDLDDEKEAEKKPSDDDDGDDGDGDEEDEEQLYGKITSLLQRGRDLNILKLEQCKAYLRRHNLRLSGTKSNCIQRIREHWRIKDGNGEKVYPRSSFVINCTGDVCTGDVILFKQRVYEKFDLVTRGANIIGMRTIAGRVVKESYGEAKQQHTFTVEVLWSKGVKALPTLFPLLVKGRNLYRLKTFRQRWDNEAERSKVLVEKHKRGAAARHVRAIAKSRAANEGCKRRRHSSDAKSSFKKQRKEEPKSKVKLQKKNNNLRKNQRNGHSQMNVKKHPKSSNKHSRDAFVSSNAEHMRYPLHQQQIPFNRNCHPEMEHWRRDDIPSYQANRGVSYFPGYQTHSSSNAIRALNHQALNRVNFFGHPPYSNYSSQFATRTSHHLLNQEDYGRVELHRWKSGSRCSTLGCRELASENCIVSCCRMCCGRLGRQCYGHR